MVADHPAIFLHEFVVADMKMEFATLVMRRMLLWTSPFYLIQMNTYEKNVYDSKR